MDHGTTTTVDLTAVRYPPAEELTAECDLVMKGGITSGVVYPLALCELARRYRFRSIGGSSAGAIAATFAAAAEFGRGSGGFARLAAVPTQVGATLGQLFGPGPSTVTAHAALMSYLDPRAPRRSKVSRVVRTLLRAQRRRFVPLVLASVLASAVLALLLAGVPDDGVSAVRFLAVVVAFGAVGTVAAALIALLAEVRDTVDGLEAQGFGVCVGSAGPDAPAGQAQPPEGAPTYLTDWLAARIDEIAGVDRPLLIGDLQAAGIDLQVMTTDLSHGRPMTFPFRNRAFLFDPDELARYFPPAVLRALVGEDGPAVDRRGRPIESAEGAPLHRLPPAPALPVVIAARLSLSFPGLISAVPLYALDRIDVDEDDDGDDDPDGERRVARRCWFSDGGITSNFPVHFFDSLWPRRPTFAIDLRPYPPGDDRDAAYGGHTPGAARYRGIGSLPGFAGAILDTMQYWADDAQSALPGYRDRVVEVRLRPDEGGFNLQMPTDVVLGLAEKGRAAAVLLADGFRLDEHRWLRYLTAMDRLQAGIERMGEVWETGTTPGVEGVRDLLDRATTFPIYARPTDWAAAAGPRTAQLLAFADGTEPDFTVGAPRPQPVLRITPRF